MFCWNCKMILDRNMNRERRHQVGHLGHCRAAEVVVATRRVYPATPGSSDLSYREGWNEDPGYNSDDEASDWGVEGLVEEAYTP